MAIRVLMPVLSPTMEKGHLVRWCKKEGDRIAIGDVLFEIETDKAVMEVEALESGVLYRILIGDHSDDVPVNSTVAILREKSDTDASIQAFASEPAPSKPAQSTPEKAAVPHPLPSSPSTPSPTQEPVPQHAPKRQAVSPLARAIANEARVDLAKLTGSGPDGRIVKKDVEAYIHAMASCAFPHASSPQAPSLHPSHEDRDLPVSTMRRTIGQVLSLSKQTIPHFYLSIECRMDDLLAIRASLNEALTGEKISVTDVIAKACALSLSKVRALNSSWEETVIREHGSVDLAIATSVEGGILTPVLRNAHCRSLRELSCEFKQLATRARQGKLQPQEFTGGTFTLSNLGMFGVERFAAIIPPGQGGILAIGATLQKPVVVRNQVTVGSIMVASLAADHRIVDGEQAALFLSTFQRYIENPALLLL